MNDRDLLTTRRPPGLPYRTPRLARLGSAAQLTQARLMQGLMDGGPNKSRTG